ncbi:class I SAM-dependent methyltransferase [Thermococcus argininiproducens]|uniref:Class I SAM-dependent methyltransferase n=1 Tax=Thermococcus argininiproducens TaxID=2866384 RepID=A0A9E7MBZ6_9EURY|nr:class I SAM-dependent methyltransferase [Thermococcus argininiproducens]USH00620.1 class I SAM-dependent methyltransferase [Thermococcus argininiproducens]
MIEGIPAPGAYLYNFLTRKRKNLDRVIAEEITNKIEHGKILDIGTGPGFIPIKIAKFNPDLEIIGIDISKTMIKLAKKNAEKAGVNNVTFEVMSAYKLRFLEEQFDLVTSIGALHHFNNPLKAFNEMYRVLKSQREVWIYDFITDTPKKDMRKFLEEVGLPKFPWSIAFRLHGLNYREWTGEISKAAEQSKFDDYKLERNKALMKLILRKF